MHKLIPIVFTIIVLFLLKGTITAQDFSATYNFAGLLTTSGRTDPTPVPVVDGLSFGSFTAVAPAGNPNGLSASPNAVSRFSFTGWPLGALNGSNVFTGAINTGQYYEVTITPLLNTMLTLDSINFTLQRSGTGIRQYALRSSRDGYAANLAASIVPDNAALQVVPDANIFQVTDASTTANDGSKLTIPDVVDLITPVTYRFYGWNAEGAGGTFSIDNVRFSGSVAPVPGSPVITLSTRSINFLPVNNTTLSTAQSFTLAGENLTVPVSLNVEAPFSISDAENGTYSSSLELGISDVVTPKTLWVKFLPVSVSSYNGSINISSGSAAKTINLAGEGIDPANLSFTFNNCTPFGVPATGFISYSISGVQKWACTSFGNGSNGIDMNGYANGAAVDNEDWLISPALSISSLNLPILSFNSRGQYAGPPLQLLVSTDYDGSSNPNTATWTDLQANFPPLTNAWTLTDGINLKAYKSFSKLYIAFKYISSTELGAAQWTLDNVSITDRSKLLTINPTNFTFNEVSAGNVSAGQALSIQSIGYGDISVIAPAGYELSLDNVIYSSSVPLNTATAEAGSVVYVRFSPITKALKWAGKLKFTGTGLDSNFLSVTGSSYPKAETFDAGAYNISFFGANADNTATPQQVTTQINNIAAVFQRLNLDVIGIEEMSNDDALAILMSKLPNYASVVSDRWSYSFNPPEPNFPPQKVGFIYNTSTMQLLDSRAMFQGLYDSARNATSHALDNYPTGIPSSFWASGRLPFMATFQATVGGVSKIIRIIDIHAKSASDLESYRRRAYDIKVLKDSLDAYYKNDNIILVGDYNDRLVGSIAVGQISPYKIFIDDNLNYNGLTVTLDTTGRVSFLSGTAMIDHMIISNELKNDFIVASADIEDPRTYISNYNATTASDHLAIYSRFLFNQVLPVNLANFSAQSKGKRVVIYWSTAAESGNSHFIIERSADGKNFTPIASVKGTGSGSSASHYEANDSVPLQGVSYYRLKQVDTDGKFALSNVVSVKLRSSLNARLHIYPNPVRDKIAFELHSASADYLAQVITMDGTVLLEAKGNIVEINLKINKQVSRLKPGAYIFQIADSGGQQSAAFIKQ